MNEKQHQEIENLSIERAVEATNEITDYDKKGEAAKELIQKLKNNKIRIVYETKFKDFLKHLVSTAVISGAFFGGTYLAVDKLLDNYPKTPPVQIQPVEVIIKEIPVKIIETKIIESKVIPVTSKEQDLTKLESVIDKLVYKRTKKERFSNIGTYNEFLKNYSTFFYGNKISKQELIVLDKILRKYIEDFDEPDFMVKYWNKHEKKLVLMFHGGLDRPILYGE